MLKIVKAVALGFFVWTVLWLSSNTLLQQAFPAWYTVEGSTITLFPLMIGLVNTFFFSVLAGYLSVKLSNHLKAAWILGLIQVLVAVLVSILLFETVPLWYHVVFLLLLLPAHLLGGQIAYVLGGKHESTQRN